jgi:hypothetical protein
MSHRLGTPQILPHRSREHRRRRRDSNHTMIPQLCWQQAIAEIEIETCSIFGSAPNNTNSRKRGIKPAHFTLLPASKSRLAALLACNNGVPLETVFHLLVLYTRPSPFLHCTFGAQLSRYRHAGINMVDGVSLLQTTSPEAA